MKGKRRPISPRRSLPLPLGLIVAGILLAIAALAIAVSNRSARSFTPQVTGAPSLAVNQELVDLGDVRLGRTVEVAFRLQNVGDRQLLFLDLPYVEVIEGC